MIARRTSLKLINEAVADKWIRQLAFYHMLKLRFNNSCIYDYRSRMTEIAGMFNISVRTLYSYLNLLKAKDLICDHATNLKLNTIRSFTSRKKSIIYINDKHCLWDITCLLYLKLIEQRARQQMFAESLRRYGKGDRFISVPNSENPFRPSLSFRTIAKVINSSEYKAFQVVQNLCKLGVIEAEKQKPQKLSDDFTDLGSVDDFPGYRFNIGSKLFEIFGTRLNFLQFPITLKQVSLKQYLKYNRTDRRYIRL